MKFIVMEIQKNAEGTVSCLCTEYPDEPHADAGYFSLCATIALSKLPKHIAKLMTEDGVELRAERYIRESANAEG